MMEASFHESASKPLHNNRVAADGIELISTIQRLLATAEHDHWTAFKLSDGETLCLTKNY